MIQLNLNRIGEGKIVLTIPLESEIDLTGLLMPISPKAIHPDPTILTDYWITGTTNSKLSFIVKSFPVGKAEVDTPTIIRGTNLMGIIKSDLNNYPIMYSIYTEDYADRQWLWANASLDGQWWSTYTDYNKITSLQINYKAQDGTNYRNWLSKFDVGSSLYLFDQGHPEYFGYYTVTSPPIMKEKFAILNVTCDKGNGSIGGGGIVQMSHTTRVEINYIDTASGTTFSFQPFKELPYADDNVFLLQYFGLVDEPKLDSSVFIDRGINNVFESFIRLKTVANIEEMGKTGFGYFNVISGT